MDFSNTENTDATSVDDMEEHIDRFSQCMIQANSTGKALPGPRKGLTSCRPSAEVSRAGLPMQRPADFTLLSDSCASALRSIFGTLSSPKVFGKKKKKFFLLPLSKAGVSRAPREAHPPRSEGSADPVRRCRSVLPLPPRSRRGRHPSAG